MNTLPLFHTVHRSGKTSIAMALSMTMSTLNPYPSLKHSLIPFKTHKLRNPITQFTASSPNLTTQSFNSRLTHASPSKKFGNPLLGTRNNNYNLGFCLKSKQGESGETLSEAEIKDFSETSLPDRFKITPHLGLPWLPYALASLALLIYTRRAVLWEVGNWKKVASLIGPFLFDCVKIVLSPVAVALVPLIKNIETTLYSIQTRLLPFYFVIISFSYVIIYFSVQITDFSFKLIGFYKEIIEYAPVGDITLNIVLPSIIFTIAETAVPDSMNSQPYIITFAGLAGFAMTGGFISVPIFWGVLLGLFTFSRFIKKKDYVSSTLPVAGVLAAVGKPWFRFIVMVSFSSLAINHHWKNHSEEKEREANSMGNNTLPFHLLCAGLTLGLRVAVKWVRYRHLTWMIV